MAREDAELSCLIEEGTAHAGKQHSARKWTLAVGGALAICAALLAFANFSQSAHEPLRPLARRDDLLLLADSKAALEYMVMVDCGSSGSRLYIYKVNKLGGILNTVDTGTRIKGDALSDYMDDPSKAGPMIAEMVQRSLPFVKPASKQASTPLYVFATAGMRLLPVDQVRAVWESVRKTLMNPTNSPYKFSPEMAGNMPGDFEGIYQYMTVQNALNDKEVQIGNEIVKSRMGIMEMGGASLQVAFRPPGPLNLHAVEFYIGEDRHQIYSTSYLGFGSNAAMDRSLSILAKKADYKAVVDDPCLFKGDSKTSTIDGHDIKFEGSGDAKKCMALVRKLLHKDYECIQEPCSIMGVYQPLPGKANKFLGISSFFYTAYNLGLLGWRDTKAIPPKDIAKGAFNVCKVPFDKLETTPPYDGPTKISGLRFMKTLCFNSCLVTELLGAFGFGADDMSVLYTKKYKGVSLTWTRGAALYQTQYMQASK